MNFKFLKCCFPSSSYDVPRVGDVIMVNHLLGKIDADLNPAEILNGFVEDGYLTHDANSHLMYHLTEDGAKILNS